jgi:hypothetical protein
VTHWAKPLLAAALLAPAACQAAPPLLSVKILAASSRWRDVAITNHYRAAAEEYVLIERYYPPGLTTRCAPALKDARGRCIAMEEFFSALPNVAPNGHNPMALPAGATRRFGGFGPADTPVAAVNMAVIYADGAMAGMPAMVDQLIRQRGRELADAEADIRILKRLLRNPQTDWARKRRMFIRRARRQGLDAIARPSVKALSAVAPPPLSDAACWLVAGALRPSLGGPTGAAAAQAAIRGLEAQIAQLERSKPAIHAPSNH